MQIKQLQNEDIDKFKLLLSREGLFSDNIEQKNFYVLKSDSVVGGYGLEVYGDDALLRSVVLASDQRGFGYGRMLVKHALEKATELGVANIYLLTTTAADFFMTQGFKVTDRQHVPPAVGNSIEFKDFCPDSATCLTYKL